MTSEKFDTLFTQEKLQELFPAERADQFFDALFGDAAEGAYDISLQFKKHIPERQLLQLELHLRERPGKCLACNLTYGLPEVFSRHPIINIKGLVENIERHLAGRASCASWQLGETQSVSKSLHVIPLTITLN